MSSFELRQALFDEVKKLAPGLLVIDADDDPRFSDIPPLDTPWLAVVHSSTSEELASIGSRGSDCWSEVSVVSLHYFSPAGTDKSTSLKAFDDLRKGLRAARLSDGVYVLDAAPPQTVGVSGKWLERVSFVDVERRNFG
jgi:hypothetical protein